MDGSVYLLPYYLSSYLFIYYTRSIELSSPCLAFSLERTPVRRVRTVVPEVLARHAIHLGAAPSLHLSGQRWCGKADCDGDREGGNGGNLQSSDSISGNGSTGASVERIDQHVAPRGQDPDYKIPYPAPWCEVSGAAVECGRARSGEGTIDAIDGLASGS